MYIFIKIVIGHKYENGLSKFGIYSTKWDSTK